MTVVDSLLVDLLQRNDYVEHFRLHLIQGVEPIEFNLTTKCTFVHTSYVPIVPDGKSGKCLDPGIQGTSPGNSVCVWRVSNPSQAMFTLSPKQRAAVETQ